MVSKAMELRPSPLSAHHYTAPHRLQAALARARPCTARSTPESQTESKPEAPAPGPSTSAPIPNPLEPTRDASGTQRKPTTDTTDPISSALTRRFGIAGGLAWVAFLTVGSLGEQVKTRLEVAREAEGTKDVANGQEVTTAEGLRYRDLRVGGGQSPPKGYLVVVDYVAKANGVVFEDTKARGKPIVFLFGSRPLTGGMCPGAEKALSSMKAGGRRVVTIPPELGFGERGAVLRPTEHVPEKQGNVPPGATLEYDIELQRVSIPPS